MMPIKTLVVAGEKYANVNDLKRAIADPQTLGQATMIMAVGMKAKHPPEEILKRVMASFIACGIGEVQPPPILHGQN